MVKQSDAASPIKTLEMAREERIMLNAWRWRYPTPLDCEYAARKLIDDPYHFEAMMDEAERLLQKVRRHEDICAAGEELLAAMRGMREMLRERDSV